MRQLFKVINGLVLLAAVFSVSVLAPTLASASEFELDMRDVEIREFIDTIAQLTGKTIIVDQRVKGRVDIRSHRKLSAKELYEVFLVQLGVNGFAVIDLGDGLTKVIPSQAAKVEGIEVSDSGAAQSSEKIVTRVVPVSNVDATKLIPILRPLIDNQTGIIAPFAESNILLITDRESNVKRLLEIISKVDRSDSQSLDMIALKNASAKEMERILNSILRQLAIGQDGGASVPSVVADVRTNSLLIVADTNVRAYLKRVILQLDADIETSSNTKVVYLKYANASELVEVLRNVSNSITQSDGGAGGNQVTLNLEAHEQTNSIILSGSPGLIKDLQGVIKKLDIRRAQVLVEAIIVEISENLTKQLGVQWLASHDSGVTSSPVGGVNFSNNGTGIVDLTGAVISGSESEVVSALSGLQGITLGLGRFQAGGLSFAALLNAIASDTGSNILSTPSILTLDNEEASILVGQEVPVITGSTAGSNNDNPFQTITRQDIGIKLKVTPQINEGDAIQLAIEQEVSSLTGLTASDIITNKRQIYTTVLADDGGVIVLGGLIDDDVQESSSKVPLLGDIPVLGHAFRSDTTRRTKRNLMVFIRPTILRDQQSIDQLSHNKYRYIRAEQMLKSEQGIKLFPGEKGPELDLWTSIGIATDR